MTLDEKLILNKLAERTRKSDIIVEPIIPGAFKNAEKIFVVGPPRSGTTLVYRMIAHELFLPECTFVSTLMKVFAETCKFSDDERFNYFAYNVTNLAEIFKKPIYDLLYTATIKVGGNLTNRYIYKDPMLTLYLEFFRLFFDDSYKIVFCIRDPRDVVSSMFKVLKKQNSETDDDTLFVQAINFIFPFYRIIYNINHAEDYIDKGKLIFVKYEDIVTGNGESIKNLEDFLGFQVTLDGGDENIKGKLSETSPFYVENYGKAITADPVGGHKKLLTPEQIKKIEKALSYYIGSLNYK